MNLSALREAEYNPRLIKNDAREALGASMADFGDLSGITFNVRTQRLVCGHQRVSQMRTQWGDLPIIESGGRGEIHAPTGDVFPVRFVDWDESKERLANVVANNPELCGVFRIDAGALLKDVGELEMSRYRVDHMLSSLKIPTEFTRGADKQSAPPEVEMGGEFDDGGTAPPFLPDAPQEREDREAEKEDKSLKYPVYFSLNKSNFERWKRLRKNLQLKDNELAVRLLDDQEAYEGE